MGLIDDKKNIFTQIGALTSIGNSTIPDTTNSLSSVNNTKEIVPFLLDMLTVIIGSEVLQITLGQLMTGYVRSVEPTLKTALKTQLIGFNSNQKLPSSFVNNGYELDTKNVDIYGKTRNDPNSDVGILSYPDNPNAFDNKLYQAQNAPGTDIPYKGNNSTDVMKMNYNDTTDTVNFKPTNSEQTIGDFTSNYIDSLTLIDEKTFVTSIVNAIFGTTTTNENKTIQTALIEEKINATIQKIINNDDNIDITNDELSQLQINAQNKVNGVEYYDVGCGQIPNNVSLNDLYGLITGTTGNTDPLTVGNAYLNTLAQGFKNTDNTNAQSKANDNSQAIKDSFFKKLINIIVNILVTAITMVPQVRAIMAIISGFKNHNSIDFGDPIDDIKKNHNLVNCLANSAKESINKFLFDLIKKELLKLVIPVTKIILREKINQYIAILLSLIRITT